MPATPVSFEFAQSGPTFYVKVFEVVISPPSVGANISIAKIAHGIPPSHTIVGLNTAVRLNVDSTKPPVPTDDWTPFYQHLNVDPPMAHRQGWNGTDVYFEITNNRPRYDGSPVRFVLFVVRP